MKKNTIKIIMFLLLIIIFLLIGYSYFKYQNTDSLLSSIQLDYKSFGLKLKESRQIEYSYLSDYKGKITWVSSDSSVIDVNSVTGYVTALREGKSVIQALDSNNNVIEECVVYGIKNNINLENIEVIDNIKLANGSSYMLTINPIPSNAIIEKFNYESSDLDIVLVDSNGRIKAVGVGTAYVTITSLDGRIKKNVLLEVTQSGEYTNKDNLDFVIDVSSIKVNKENVNLKINDIYQIDATVLPKNATNQELSYKSTNEDVVLVLENGVIKAKKEGSSVIEIRSINNIVKKVFVKVEGKNLDNIVNVSGIEVNSTNISLVEGESKTLITTVLPVNATNKNLTFTSSNTSVATVVNGKITGKGEGNCIITIKSNNGITRKVNVTVNKEIITPTDLTLSVSSISLSINETYSINALVSPLNATIKTLNYSSSNTRVATVENGLIKAISPGGSTISVKTNNGIEKKIYVEVKTIEPTNLILSKENTTLKVGEKETITYSIVPSNVTNKNITWSSSNSSVVSVLNGVLTANKIGEAVVTSKIGNIKKTINVKVVNKKINVESVSITGPTNVFVSEQISLKAVINPSNATNQKITWKTSDNKIASINQNGVVTGLKKGEATITATVGSKSSSIKIKVNEVEVSKVSLNLTEVNLDVNKSISLIASINPENATNKNLVWISSNPTVAKVSSSGIVTALKEGSSTITAKSSNGKTSQAVVKVKKLDVPVNSIKLNKSSLDLLIGEEFTLIATIEPSNATNKSITWTSSNSNVASVSGGKVIAKGEGSCTITAKTSNGKSISATINVKNNLITNPILEKGADPYVMQKDGYYYATLTTGRAVITIYKSKNLHNIFDSKNAKHVYWENITNVVWAPEIHYIDGRWYVYYSDAKKNGDVYRRMYVLRSKTSDAQGEYEYLGQITDSTDKYAIDGTVLNWQNQLYFIWSGRGSNSSNTQNIYIARMKNPYTIDSERVLISAPTHSWEKHGHNVNEGPQILIKNGQLHIIYSASGAYTKYYCLGMLTYTGGDLLNASSWKKNSSPVFQSGNGIYGPGHASFVKSPDLKEDWIVYHAYSSLSDVKDWNNRNIRIQKFTWNSTTPVFGTPLKTEDKFTLPSGTK